MFTAWPLPWRRGWLRPPRKGGMGSGPLPLHHMGPLPSCNGCSTNESTPASNMGAVAVVSVPDEAARLS
eukprot:13278211-Heterocapsa_arctica.AAC.1